MSSETSCITSPHRSALRRFLDGWRRMEQAMDYGPHEYANDRLRALEQRVEQLERRLAIAIDDSTSPAPRALSPATSTHQR